MTVLTSTLRLQLVDDVSTPAHRVTEALQAAEKHVHEIEAALKASGTSDRLQVNLQRLGATAPQIEGVTRAWGEFVREEGIAGKATAELTADQVKAIRSWESVTTATVKAIIGEEKTLTAASRQEEATRIADRQREEEALVAAAQRSTKQTLDRERQLQDQLADQDRKAEDRRIAMLAADAERRASVYTKGMPEEEAAARRHQAVRDAIEHEITTKMRSEIRDRVAASQEEAVALDRIANHEKELRLRAITAETEAIVAARHRQAEAEAHAMQHVQNRGGFRHFALTGIAAGVSAHGVVAGGERVLEAGAERQSERINMANAGISPAEIVRIEDQALRLSTIVGNVSQTQVMEVGKELRSIIQNPDELSKVLDPVIRAKSVLDAMDTTGGSSEGIAQLLKAGELVGAGKDPERLTRLIDGWVRVMQVSGKTVNPEQIFEFVKYSKTAGATLSDRFLTTVGPSILQELGGSTTGNDIAMMSKTIATGFGKNHTAMREAARIGLINPDDIDYLKTGEAKGLKPGKEHAVRGDRLFQTDPDKWVYDVLVPHLEAANIKSTEDQLAFVQRVFTGTSADFISKSITQRSAYDTHASNYALAAGLGGVDKNAASAAVGVTALSKAISNLEANVSVSAMDAIGPFLNRTAGWINQLADIAKDHPNIAMAAGGAVGAGALAGAGWLSYQFMNGFGLGTAATALDGSAVLLNEAAVALGARSAMPGGVVPEVVKDAAKAGAPSILPTLAVPSVVTLGAGLAGLGGAAVVTQVVKESFAAQAPGKGGQWSAPTDATRDLDASRLADQKAEKADLEQQIHVIEARSRNPDAAAMLTQPLRDQLAEKTNQIALLEARLAALKSPDRPKASPLAPELPAAINPPAIQRFADGGPIWGRGGPREDRVPILASPGEFVINARSTTRHRSLVEAINEDRLPGYADGGAVTAPGASRVDLRALIGTGTPIYVHPQEALRDRGPVSSRLDPVPVSLVADSSSAAMLRAIFTQSTYEAVKRALGEGGSLFGGGEGSPGMSSGDYGRAAPPSIRYNRQHRSLGEGPPDMRYGSHGRTPAGSMGIAYEAKSATEVMGISGKEWDAYREGVTDIEGKRYDRMGGAGGRFAGRYQMGQAEIADTARRLGVAVPSQQEFLSNPQMQERFFENYTVDHYRTLIKNPKFADMSHRDQLKMLGYAHNQGTGGPTRENGAWGYIDKGRVGADAFGTAGTAYFGPIGRRLDEAERGGDRPTAQGGSPATMDPDVRARIANLTRPGALTDEQCVTLAMASVGVQKGAAVAGANVHDWRKGEGAEEGTLKPGTPIATFLDRMGRETNRYAGGGAGTPGAHLDHAGVFEAYLRDAAGKAIGMRIAEQYQGSRGVHDRDYYFHKGWGEGDAASYHAIKGPDGAYLGGANNPMTGAEFDRRQREAEGAIPRRPAPTAAVPEEHAGAPLVGAIDLNLDKLKEARHHVRALKTDLASLGSASIDVKHRGFGSHGSSASGSLRTALNGGFSSDGRAFT